MTPLPMMNRPDSNAPGPAAVLGAVRVATPCHADWTAMVGDDRSRFCPSCRKNVYNLSAMTAREAADLVQAKEGKLCVRYYQRADGTVLTANCPVGIAAAKRKAARVPAAGVVGFAALFSAATQWWVTADGGNLFAKRWVEWAARFAPAPQVPEQSLGGTQIDTPAPVASPIPVMGNYAPVVTMGAPMPMMGKIAAPPLAPKLHRAEHNAH